MLRAQKRGLSQSRPLRIVSLFAFVAKLKNLLDRRYALLTAPTCSDQSRVNERYVGGLSAVIKHYAHKSVNSSNSKCLLIFVVVCVFKNTCGS